MPPKDYTIQHRAYQLDAQDDYGAAKLAPQLAVIPILVPDSHQNTTNGYQTLIASSQSPIELQPQQLTLKEKKPSQGWELTKEAWDLYKAMFEDEKTRIRFGSGSPTVDALPVTQDLQAKAHNKEPSATGPHQGGGGEDPNLTALGFFVLWIMGKEFSMVGVAEAQQELLTIAQDFGAFMMMLDHDPAGLWHGLEGVLIVYVAGLLAGALALYCLR
ncbi:hypothetical protein BD289DRAFT_455543 [Coniella lustricola]|uniref:Uncharacterized protein n=1 Tax=Coniella lustricola TaxID=2025994 RepID=A0A2T2ZZB9_9PEZI|nr:hypothetical protein BD289DRAFT_455543 [Coniella lustricola]